MTVHSVRMPVGFGRGINSTGRQLSFMAQLKRCVLAVKATENCLAHAIVIAIAKAETLRSMYRTVDVIIRSVAQKLLPKTGIDLSGGGGSTN